MKPREAYFDMSPGRLGMLVAALVVVVVVGRWAIKGMFSSGEAHAARVRVTEVFDGLKAATESDLALKRWYGGPVPTDIDGLNLVAGDFERWCAARGLTPVKTYEIKDAKETGEKDAFGAAAVVVSGTVNDRPFRVRVQRGQAMRWVD